MDKPPDSASATPPLATQLHLELPTHSRELIVANLGKLSDCLSSFRRCLTELQLHIRSSCKSIHSYTLSNTNSLSPALPAPEPQPSEKEEEEEEVEIKDEEEEEEEEMEEVEEEIEEEEEVVEEEEEEQVEDVEIEDEEEEVEEEMEEQEEEEEEEEEVEVGEGEEVETPLYSELASLCQAMNSHDLKNYMVKHISDSVTLREQLPKALKLSENPIRLVLNCLDNFYLRGKSEYVRGSPLNDQRKACVLALECLLLMMVEGEGVEVAEGVKKDAKLAALAWKGRLFSERAVGKTHRLDAQGLLLLLGCFGVPAYGFLHSDIRLLLRLGAKGIYDALKRSSVFMEFIPGLVEWRSKENLVEAIDIAYTFGIEDKFDIQRLVTSFLDKSNKTLKKKIKGFKKTSTVRTAKKRYLFTLQSVFGCLRRHGVDAYKLIPGWQLEAKIMILKKELVELTKCRRQEELAELIKNIRDQKMAQKRKIDETETSGFYNNKEIKASYPSNPNPLPPHQQKVVNHVDNSNNTLLEGGGTAGRIYGYPVSTSVVHAPVAGSIHENAVGSRPGPVGGVVATGGAGAGARKSVQGGSSAGVHGLSLVDSTPGQIGSHTDQLYGRLGDAVVYDRLASHNYACRPSSYLEGSGTTGLPNSITVDNYRSSAYLEDSTRLPNTIPGDAYKPPSYLEASMGLSNRISADAYRPPPYLEAATRLPNTITGDAYKPPPYLKASMGLPNSIPGDAYKPPAYLVASSGSHTTSGGAYRPPLYLEGPTRLPNTKPADAYNAPPYLKASMGLPNTIRAHAYRPPPYLEAYTDLPNTMPADASGPPSYLKGSTGLPNTTSGDAYRPPPYLVGSTGLPNTKPMMLLAGTSTSDTHQFPDTVPATELYQSSGPRAVDTVPPAHSSSYLYLR